jgi:hypothetical protein
VEQMENTFCFLKGFLVDLALVDFEDKELQEIDLSWAYSI